MNSHQRRKAHRKREREAAARGETYIDWTRIPDRDLTDVEAFSVKGMTFRRVTYEDGPLPPGGLTLPSDAAGSGLVISVSEE